MRRLFPRWILIVGFVAVLGGLQPVQAVPITGAVAFYGQFDPIDAGGNTVGLGAATGIDFGATQVLGASGDLGSLAFGTPATFSDFQFSPQLVSPVDPLWMAGIFQFVLNSVEILSQNDTFLALNGSGIMYANGFDATSYDWSFVGTAQGGQFSFSSPGAEPIISQAVPEPGAISSMMLFGLGILGICAWDRRSLRRNGY